MADREPEDLRLETTSQRRDTITFVVPTQVRNDEGVFVRQDIDRVYELKLGIELSLGDFTEIERCMKRLDALPPPTEAGKRLAALRSVIHRMVSTAIIDPVPTDVLDSLNIDKLEKLGRFLFRRSGRAPVDQSTEVEAAEALPSAT